MKYNPDDFAMSPLAAYGLIAIALILGLVGLEKFAAAETRLEQTVIAAQTELATLKTIGETDHWEARLSESAKSRKQLEGMIWQGTTSGVIAAQLQQSLRALGTDHDFKNIQVRVDPDPIDVNDINVLKFEFSGQATSAKLAAHLFEDIATHPKIIIIEETNFSQSVRDRRPPRVALAGFIPVQIASSGGS